MSGYIAGERFTLDRILLTSVVFVAGLRILNFAIGLVHSREVLRRSELRTTDPNRARGVMLTMMEQLAVWRV